MKNYIIGIVTVGVVAIVASTVYFFTRPEWQRPTAPPERLVAGEEETTAGRSERPGGTTEGETGEEPTTVDVPGETRGKSEDNLVVTVYDRTKAYNGTTLLADHKNSRIIEVNMLGEIIWEYKIADNGTDQKTAASDAEYLPNGNILVNVGRSGIFEVTRAGEIVWQKLDKEVSHDSDRLANGNTLYNFGMNDKKSDAQVKEVDEAGNIVWQWFARDVYGSNPGFSDISNQGWTHQNAVQRLDNGNTLVSLRNFNMTAIIDANGKLVKEYRYDKFGENTYPHEPEMMDNGNIIVCLQADAPYVAVEIDGDTEELVWSYPVAGLRTSRDCDRLPNGNTLIVSVDTTAPGHESVIIEVTPQGEKVWELRMKEPVEKGPGWFFKAQRTAY